MRQRQQVGNREDLDTNNTRDEEEISGKKKMLKWKE